VDQVVDMRASMTMTIEDT